MFGFNRWMIFFFIYLDLATDSLKSVKNEWCSLIRDSRVKKSNSLNVVLQQFLETHERNEH